MDQIREEFKRTVFIKLDLFNQSLIYTEFILEL